MKTCVLCGLEFNEKDLDYTGRCDSCFEKWKGLTEDQKRELKGKLGIPFTPGYDSTWNK